MTDPFPFGAAEDEPLVDQDAPDTKDSRRTMLAVGALAAVALGAGGYLFLGGGGDDAVDEASAPVRAPRAAAAAAKAPAVVQAVKLPVASTVQLGRNPFKALYVEPAAAATGTGTSIDGSAPTAPSGGTTAPTTTPVDTTTGSTPIVVVSGGGTPTTSGGTSSPAPQPVSSRSTVKLTSVSDKGTPVGTFVLDGKELTGKEGDVLGGKLLVISLQQDPTGAWFANLQVGDGSPFEVHQRQEVVVQ